MLCQFCGSELEESHNHCGNCNAKVETGDIGSLDSLGVSKVDITATSQGIPDWSRLLVAPDIIGLHRAFPASDGGCAMRLADKLQQCLDEMGWDDVIKRNVEKQTSQMSTSWGINEQGFRLYLETDEKKDWIQLYLYTPFSALQNKRAECAILFDFINSASSVGSIHVLRNGDIRFVHTIDFEGAEPSTTMLKNMIYSGSSLFAAWFEEIIAVALTKKTAQEVFDELDKLEEDAQDKI